MLVLQALVKPGSFVKKGEVIGEFDRQYMLTRLDDYRASMDQVEAGMRILQSDLDVEKKAHTQLIEATKADLDKALIDLKTLPVQSDIDAEKLKLTAQEADARHKQLLGEVKLKEVSQKAQERVAEIERQQARIELQRAEANADRMLVRAPMDGITVMQTTLRGSEFGQIQQGDTLYPGQLYMRVVDPSSMVVNAAVNQVDVERLRIGARARVRFDAYPDLELPAHVYSIGAMPKGGGFRASYVKEVPVALKLDKMDHRVIPDLSVSADVVVAREGQVVIAPLETIFRDAGTGRPFVMLQRPSGWERREVDLGLVNNLAAAVRSGLRPGDIIAAEPPPSAANPPPASGN